MKIIDKHVTRIELSADEVDKFLANLADELYRTGEIPDPGRAAAWMAPPSLPAAPGAIVPPISQPWTVQKETKRDADGGAAVTITRTR